MTGCVARLWTGRGRTKLSRSCGDFFGIVTDRTRVRRVIAGDGGERVAIGGGLRRLADADDARIAEVGGADDEDREFKASA